MHNKIYFLNVYKIKGIIEVFELSVLTSLGANV